MGKSTAIYLIRHTQAEGNKYRIIQGHCDGDVTLIGLKEIDALSERFRDIRLDAVYSSDLYRAVLTAQGAAKYSGIPVQTDIRLRELNMGAWEGCFFGNVAYESPEASGKFLNATWDWKIEGAETLEDVSVRACEVLRELAEKHLGDTIAVVSHGMAIRCILTKLIGYARSGEGMAPIVSNTGVTKLIFDGENFTAEYINDTAHLAGLGVSDWIQRNGLRNVRFSPTADRQYYAACYTEAWSFAHGGSTEGFNPETYFKAAQRHFAYDSDSVMRLYRDNDAAGLVDLDAKRGKDEGYGWISLLYLSPEFRGQGFGIQALARAIMFYKARGRTALRLNVSASNRTAIDFYKHNLFKIIGTEQGAGGPIYLMERTLGHINEDAAAQ